MAALQSGSVGTRVRRRSIARVARRLALAALPAACSLVTAASAQPADLYVSPGGSDEAAGSQQAPLRTIGAASERARPGTTVHVAPGSYDGGLITSSSGTADAPIRYVSVARGRAIIRPPGRSIRDMAWENRGAYVVIDGFDVDGSEPGAGLRWRIGIYSTGSGSVIENNRVHHIARDVPCNGRGGAGIEGDSWSGGSDISLTGNIVHDIGPRLCKFIQGLYQTASGTVANNLVYRVSGWGIHLWHDVHDVRVVNNTVFNSAAGGILVGGGDYVHTTGPADHIVVANNIVFDNAGYGIIEDGDTGSHNLFTHNLVYRSGINWRLKTSAADRAAIAADPRFVRYDRDGGGDYRLAPDSPAIGAGALDYAPVLDLAGTTRQRTGGDTIGAFDRPAPH